MATQSLSISDIFRGMMQPKGYGRAQANAGLIDARRRQIEEETNFDNLANNARVDAGSALGGNLAQLFLDEGMQGPPTATGAGPVSPPMDDPRLPPDVQRGMQERLHMGRLAPVIATGANDLANGVTELRTGYERIPRFEENPTRENFAAAFGKPVSDSASVSDLGRYLDLQHGKNREVLVNPASGDVVSPSGGVEAVGVAGPAERDNQIRLSNMLRTAEGVDELGPEEQERLRNLSAAFLNNGMTPDQALNNALVGIYGGNEYDEGGWFSSSQFGQGIQTSKRSDGVEFVAGDIQPGKGGVSYMFVGGDANDPQAWLPVSGAR